VSAPAPLQNFIRTRKRVLQHNQLNCGRLAALRRTAASGQLLPPAPQKANAGLVLAHPNSIEVRPRPDHGQPFGGNLLTGVSDGSGP